MMKKIIIFILIILIFILCCVFRFYLMHPVVGRSNSDGTFVYKGTLYTATPSDDCVRIFIQGKCLGNLDSSFRGTPIYAIENDDKGYIIIYSFQNETIYSPVDKNLRISKGKDITSIFVYNLNYSVFSGVTDLQTIISLEKLVGDEYSYKSESSAKFSVSLWVL